MVKKILSSKLFRAFFSITLIYLAFRKVNIIHLAGELALVPVWFVVAMMLYLGITMFIGGIRWSYLVVPNPTVKDFWNFTRATYLGGFYSLFFPTMVAGDMLKWLPLLEKYPELSKTKLAASVLIDRIVGFTAFTLVGFTALMVGKILKYQFPPVLLWLFSGLTLGVVVFYIVVLTIDFDAVLAKFKFKFKLINKLLEVMDLLKSGNKKRLLICFLWSMIGEPIWMLPFWFYSLVFKAGISLLQVYIFVPVISLILVLPISVAGFGARESLFLYFFHQLGFADEKILLVSTFGGLVGILNSAVGGILLLIH